MICPHYKEKDKCVGKGNIDNKIIAQHLASKGGKKSKRAISPEAQEKMQAARKKGRE